MSNAEAGPSQPRRSRRGQTPEFGEITSKVGLKRRLTGGGQGVEKRPKGNEKEKGGKGKEKETVDGSVDGPVNALGAGQGEGEHSDAESDYVPQSTTVPSDPSWESDLQWLEMAVSIADDEDAAAKLGAGFAKYKAARLYWSDQRLYEHLLEARGNVDARAKSTNLEAAFATYFARSGILHVGDERCKACRDLVFHPKKKNKKGVPGLLLQCKQTAANKRCAQCAASGIPCSLDRSAVDSIKVSSTLPVHADSTIKEVEKAVVAVEKVWQAIDDDDEHAVFSLEDFKKLRKDLDKAYRASNRVSSMAKGIDEVFVDNYDPHYALDNNGRKVKLWTIVGKQ